MPSSDDGRGDVFIKTLTRGRQKAVPELHRFFLLLLAFSGSIVVSFSYAFNLISRAMTTRYSLSMRDLSTISTCGIAIQYFMMPYGILYDFLGPIPISIIGTVYFPLGTLLLALCFNGVINGSVAKLSVFNAMMCSGCGQFDLASCMTIISHFPTHKGLVTALLKTYTGLGSAIVGCIYLGFFNGHVDHYFFFLMAYTGCVGVLYIIFMRLPEYHLTGLQRRRLTDEKKQKREDRRAQYLRQEPPRYRFFYGFTLMIILIIYLPLEGALVAYLKLQSKYRMAFAVVAVILTLLNVFICFPSPFLDKLFGYKGPYADEDSPRESQLDVDAVGADAVNDFNEPDAIADVLSYEQFEPVAKAGNGDGVIEEAVVAEGDSASRRAGPVETDVDFVAPQYGQAFWKSLCTIELWGIWWTFFCVAGAEFVVIYNATFILGALDGKDPDESLTALLTVLNGVGSAVGRLLMSGFEIWTQKRPAEQRIPITVALFFPTSSIIVTLVLFLVLPGAALPVPYVIAALGNGFLAATTMLVTRTIYARDPAKHYNFCFTANMTAAIVLNRFLYAEWYTHKASQNKKNGAGSDTCYGRSCVMMPMLVMLGLAVSAFASDIIVHVRYSRYCRRVLDERARLRGEAQSDLIESAPSSEEAR